MFSLTNFYSTTTTSSIPGTTADGSFTVSVPPSGSFGWLLIDYDDLAKREVIKYYQVNGSAVSYRGIDRPSPIAHAIGAKVMFADLAEYFNLFMSLVGTSFMLEKTAALQIKCHGGYIRLGEVHTTVADATLSLTDNASNYIYLDTADGVIKKTTSLATAEAGVNLHKIVTSGGNITSITNYCTKDVQDIGANAEVAANTLARHTHSNKTLLDSYTQSNSDLSSAVSLRHAHDSELAEIESAVAQAHGHDNKALLDGYDQTNEDIVAAINNIQRFEKPSLSGQASGVKHTETVHTNSLGVTALLYMGSDGQLRMVDADDPATAPAVAMALQSGTGTKQVLTFGWMKYDSWDFVPGKLIYASLTTGAMTTDPVTSFGSGDAIQIIGRAHSPNLIWFAPELGYAVLK